MVDQRQKSGNAGDVLKHAVWCALLRAAGPERVVVLETHAGQGLYDIASDEGREHLHAPLPERDESVTAPYAAVLRAVRAAHPGRRVYPGSPLIAAYAGAARDPRSAFFESDATTASLLTAALRSAGSEARVFATSAMGPGAPPEWTARSSESPTRDAFVALLVDPFDYVRDADDTAITTGVVHRRALADVIARARLATGPGADGVAAFWTHRDPTEVSADLAALLDVEHVHVAHIHRGLAAPRYHLALGALGPVGAAALASVASAPWAASPLLESFGLRVTFDLAAR